MSVSLQSLDSLIRKVTRNSSLGTRSPGASLARPRGTTTELFCCDGGGLAARDTDGMPIRT